MKKRILAVAVTSMLLSASVFAQETVVPSRVGDLKFESDFPTQETMKNMLNEMDFQRATQAYLWGIPASSIMEWLNVSRNDFKFEEGQLGFYNTLKQKQGIITANYTTPYVVGTWNLEKTGPLIINLPEAKMAGMLLDVHQRVLSDLSLLGPDKGKGGKYLIVPPSEKYKDLNPKGYYVIRPKNNVVFAGLRILEPDVDRVVKQVVPNITTQPYADGKLGRKIPVAQVPEIDWTHIPKDGLEYWKTIHQIIQENPVEERDRFVMAQLKFLGIEKGKPFNPTEEQKKILLEASKVGRAMAQSNDYTKRFTQPYWKGTNWKDAISVSLDQRSENYDELDERAAWFYEAITVSRGMKSTIPGFGQRYLVTYQDSDGNWLSGEHTYKLHVPANVPASNFWSTTVYDENNRLMIINDAGSPDISSRKNLKVNSDGSIDVYYGPKPVKGYENNWVQTNPGEGWFTYFRFYGPTEKMFDKSWTMGDIELVK
ncbi:DUF1254 domain-containing protein [Vibrio parahaemolyticus]|uniref:DUF1254 domain-containing protein n=1 Tax=Vibrio parahaemolyticus TaxID=670 RepID=UPI00111F1415|nr:DUF1254 domain-containing protein [Vibrio parahaemolyticus]EJG1689669.1 DUF1254 domain-containing protein [Vibrio parahaemolyticus]MCC3796430.1 DUF1254 domain-containing protein [Vibrio parahaemolyticus]MCC3811237.1 DUF1254 domain-containing protein [Vibrio parahaemolyticus]MDF5344569.1 DUF1254 domain-containing protein [Vibrio parahaemolyticus]MEA5368491.1 DUF1254 domain-containing protein [Vibrio parahaemolyticus]